MNNAAMPWNLDTSIPSDHSQACDLIRLTLDQLEKGSWSEADIFAIQMALEESLMNAIKHGNKSDPAKSVHVVIQLTDEDFFLKVADEGAGFQLCDVPDPTCDENIEKCSGRGIMLMRHLMDTVEYNYPGNSVQMRKHRRRDQ